MKKLLTYIEALPLPILTSLCISLVLLIGLADYFLGHEVSTTLLYFLPIVIAAWYAPKNYGVLIAYLAAGIWLITDIGSGREYSHQAIAVWNTAMRLCIFLIIAKCISLFHELFHNEEIAADTDALTGILNARGFKERMEVEHSRSKRYNRPFSLAYIDIDNFKYVNDTFGHAEGDRLLTTIVNSFETKLRATDIFARLGGDEFAILFPETSSDTVHHAFAHAHQYATTNIQENNWPVTFSVGIVTFDSVPDSIEMALEITDNVMYGVKKNMKNSVTYTVWSGSSKEIEA